jgi:type I restriction enzyme S subunit
MFITRAAPEQVYTNRLDADFYRPEYLAIDQKLASIDTAPLGACGKFFAGPFGSKLPSNLYLNKGIPLFRVGNVGQFEVLTDNFAHLAPTVHQELISSEVIPGDILIVKASVGEKIAKVPDWLPKANITQHIIGIRPNGVFDSDFICAFLYSKFGRSQLERFALGSIIQYLGINDARTVHAYKPSSIVQKYIGDKVRQAERLMAWANNLQDQIVGLSGTAAIQKALTAIGSTSSWVPSDDLTPRLDPKYYGNRALAVLHATESAGVPLGDLVLNICNGFEEREFFDDGITYITVSEVSSGRLDLSSAPLIHRSTNIPSKARINRKCVLVVRTGSIGTAVKVDERDTSAVISSHLIKLEFDNEVVAAAVACFLNSEGGKVLLRKISYGAVQPQIGQDELLAIPIPQAVVDRAEELLQLMTAYEDSIRSAKRLVLTSKRLVEALIEGVLAQQQLIDAQKALATDDANLDRDILSRLTTEGMDGDGDPLFPDLGELYDLLAQSQRLNE